MNLIPCALDCDHQKEGYCGLETTSAVTNTAGGCPYFVKKQVGAPNRENLRLPDAPVFVRGGCPPYAPGLSGGIADPLSDAVQPEIRVEPVRKSKNTDPHGGPVR